MIDIDLNVLRDRAYKCACDHGFHEKEHSDDHWLMLIITEISEAVNADRKDQHADISSFYRVMDSMMLHWVNHGKIDKLTRCFETFIKDSVGDELADVAIRIFDYAGVKGINFEKDDVLLFDNNFGGDKSFSERCFYLCRLIADNFSYSKLQENIKILLADLFQLARRYNIDLMEHIKLKMQYNELRPYKNGKNY